MGAHAHTFLHHCTTGGLDMAVGGRHLGHHKILFHAAVVNNLADNGDVLVKRMKFVGGRSVGPGRST